MKAKKALKRLTRVETLLANVIEQYADSQARVRGLLDSAKESISRAMKTVHLKASKSPKKSAPKRGQAKKSRLTAAGRKKLSLAAKKRWALVKRKGVQSVKREVLSKTA